MSLTAIREVDPLSPARRAGVRPGEVLLRVNGHDVADVLDYKYYTYDPRLVLTLRTPQGDTRTVRVRKGEGEDLGLTFETYLMDKARCCANRCLFCFVDQMPPGMRDTLYFKDDDARLSFLMGNYITLTNLSRRELQRIVDLRISPINVSVHATDPALRTRLLQNPRAGECLEHMRTFAQAGITMNCQIVACPGLNDGPALDQTLSDLSQLYPGVKSIAVVPVGLTRYRQDLYPLEPYTPQSAGALLDQVEGWARRFQDALGTRLVWCSDEFYLKAGRPIPPEEDYEDFAQLENGVGMLRLLSSEFGAALLCLEGEACPPPFSIATGRAAAPWIQSLVDRVEAKYPGLAGRVYPIENRFFGPEVTVAGLVTGTDLIEQLRGRDLGERLLLPINMLRHGEHVFLDDVTVEQVEGALGVRVVTVEQDGGALADAIFDQPSPLPADTRPTGGAEEYYTYNPPRTPGPERERD